MRSNSNSFVHTGIHHMLLDVVFSWTAFALTAVLPVIVQMDIPDVTGREQILRVLLASESVAPDFDFAAVAARTEGYTGSDLKVRMPSTSTLIKQVALRAALKLRAV